MQVFLRRALKYCVLVFLVVIVFNLWTTWKSPETTRVHTALRLNVTETIHIGTIVTDHTECRLISLLIKSVLAQRNKPVHFHFVTDATSKRILQNIVNSWNIPQLIASFYTDQTDPRYAVDIHTASPQGVAVLGGKAKILKFLSSEVRRIILMEPNTIVMTAIEKLWRGQLLETNSEKAKDLAVLLIDMPVSQAANGKMPVHVYLPTWTVYLFCLTNTKEQTKCPTLHILSENAEKPSVEAVRATISLDGYELQEHSDRQTMAQRLWNWFALRSCDDFQEHKFRIHPYYVGHPYQPLDEYDVTLITQLSLDRISMIEMILEMWDGPVSAALYVEDAEMLTLFERIHLNSILQRGNVAIHIVYKKQAVRYPTNFLRNLAWTHSNTPYVFLDDVDLIPKPGTYVQVRNALRQSPLRNTAFIVPAFETKITGLPFPRSKEQLIELMQHDKVTTCRVNIYAPSHGPTDYDRWLATSQPYETKWTYNYEPYIVVRRDGPGYDERFVGYGKDKVTQIEELHAQGCRFIVLPDVFLIHYPHSITADEILYTMIKPGITKHYYNCIERLEMAFLEDLRRKYGYVRAPIFP